jgi:hypothetical protein
VSYLLSEEFGALAAPAPQVSLTRTQLTPAISPQVSAAQRAMSQISAQNVRAGSSAGSSYSAASPRLAPTAANTLLAMNRRPAQQPVATKAIYGESAAVPSSMAMARNALNTQPIYSPAAPTPLAQLRAAGEQNARRVSSSASSPPDVRVSRAMVPGDPVAPGTGLVLTSSGGSVGGQRISSPDPYVGGTTRSGVSADSVPVFAKTISGGADMPSSSPAGSGLSPLMPQKVNLRTPLGITQESIRQSVTLPTRSLTLQRSAVQQAVGGKSVNVTATRGAPIQGRLSDFLSLGRWQAGGGGGDATLVSGESGTGTSSGGGGGGGGGDVEPAWIEEDQAEVAPPRWRGWVVALAAVGAVLGIGYMTVAGMGEKK